MFGVDKLERHLFDVISTVLRLALKAQLTDSAHLERLREAVLEYEETQRSEWNAALPGPVKTDGKTTGTL